MTSTLLAIFYLILGDHPLMIVFDVYKYSSLSPDRYTQFEIMLILSFISIFALVASAGVTTVLPPVEVPCGTKGSVNTKPDAFGGECKRYQWAFQNARTFDVGNYKDNKYVPWSGEARGRRG